MIRFSSPRRALSTGLLFLWIGLLASAGCTRQASPRPSDLLSQWEGEAVTLFFKRDQLGAAGDPIAPTTTWQNNTKVSLNGRILAIDGESILFDSQYKANSGDSQLRNSIFWIPKTSILTIERRKPDLP